MKTIGVKCPFTGREDLLVPGDDIWYERVQTADGTDRVFYFPEATVRDRSMQSIIRYLMDAGLDTEETVAVCEAILRQRGDLVQIGDWWFIKLPPRLPRIYPLSEAEVVLFRAGKRVNSFYRITEYLQKLLEILNKDAGDDGEPSDNAGILP